MFTQLPPRPYALRDELSVQVQAVDVGDPQAIAGALRERGEHALAKLAVYDDLRERLLAGRSEAELLDSDDRIGPYLTLLRGRAFEEENLAWSRRAIELLEQRGGRSAAATSGLTKSESPGPVPTGPGT